MKNNVSIDQLGRPFLDLRIPRLCAPKKYGMVASIRRSSVSILDIDKSLITGFMTRPIPHLVTSTETFGTRFY